MVQSDVSHILIMHDNSTTSDSLSILTLLDSHIKPVG
jgi:hypothetical protein